MLIFDALGNSLCLQLSLSWHGYQKIHWRDSYVGDKHYSMKLDMTSVLLQEIWISLQINWMLIFWCTSTPYFLSSLFTVLTFSVFHLHPVESKKLPLFSFWNVYKSLIMKHWEVKPGSGRREYCTITAINFVEKNRSWFQL